VKTALTVAIAAIIGGLTSRSLRYWQFVPSDDAQWGFAADAVSYWSLAGNLLAGRGFVDGPGGGHLFLHYANNDFVPDLVRMPAYPVFLALGRVLWNDVGIAYLGNYLVYGTICLYSALIARLLWKPSRSLWLIGYVLLVALSPALLIYTQGVQSDTFCAALLLAFTYHLLLLTQHASRAECPKWSDWWVRVTPTWVTGALLVLSRPNAVLYAASLTVVLALLSAGKRERVARLSCVSVLAVCALVISMWSARNFVLSGVFSPSIFIGRNLFINYVENAGAPQDAAYEWRGAARGEQMARRVAEGMNPSVAEADVDASLGSISLGYAVSEPQQALQRAGTSLLSVFLLSYWDIADVAVAKVLNLGLVDNHYLSLSTLRQTNAGAATALLIARSVHYAYKALLLIGFCAFPFLVRDRARRVWAAVWVACLVFTLGTALVVATTGDRLLLPIQSLCLLFLLVGAQSVSGAVHGVGGKLRVGGPVPDVISTSPRSSEVRAPLAASQHVAHQPPDCQANDKYQAKVAH
jgi:hypothetical protein